MKFSYEKFLEAKTGHPYLNVRIHPDDVVELLLELDNHPQFLWVIKDKPSSFNPLETDTWKRSLSKDEERDIYIQIKFKVRWTGGSTWSMTWGTVGNNPSEYGNSHSVSIYDLLDDDGTVQSMKDLDITNLL